MWFKPFPVCAQQELPDRSKERSQIRAGEVKRKLSIKDRWEKAEKQIKTSLAPKSAFLQIEAEIGGREPLIARLKEVLTSIGDYWEYDSVESLCADVLKEWSGRLDTVADLVGTLPSRVEDVS